MPPVAMCLNAGAMGRQDAETETLIPTRGGGFDVVAFGHQNSASQGDSVSDHVVPTLDKSKTPAVAIQARAVSENLDAGPQGKGYQNGLAYTLEARSEIQSVATPWAVRRLTPRECERLQGFPDDFTAIPYRGKPADLCPDGPRYKALGNSMAVPVMRWIGERIAMIDAACAAQWGGGTEDQMGESANA